MKTLNTCISWRKKLSTEKHTNIMYCITVVSEVYLLPRAPTVSFFPGHCLSVGWLVGWINLFNMKSSRKSYWWKPKSQHVVHRAQLLKREEGWSTIELRSFCLSAWHLTVRPMSHFVPIVSFFFSLLLPICIVKYYAGPQTLESTRRERGAMTSYLRHLREWWFMPFAVCNVI